MERRVLRSTGISVSGFALAMMLLGAQGDTDHDESIRMIRAALDAGINFVDTADVYSRGESEEIVGKALAGCRANVVLATEFGLTVGGHPDRQGASPRWTARSVEDSRRRLDTDSMDLYQQYRPDYHTDLDETVGALSDLIPWARSAPSAHRRFQPTSSRRRGGRPSAAATTAFEQSSPLLDPHTDH